MNPSLIEIIGACLFGVAVLHTFSTKFFLNLAHTNPKHSGLWHLLGEVEAVFGFWAMVLVVFMFFIVGKDHAVEYIDSRNFTEPLFVFVIMVVAASKPILVFAEMIVKGLSRVMPMNNQVATYFVLLAIVPLFGSFITEPAAMTLAALLLRDRFYNQGISTRMQYATLGVLFVNISIGGTLTPYAAPPILIVASTWGFDLHYTLTNFGYKAAMAVLFNATVITAFFVRELNTMRKPQTPEKTDPMPLIVIAIHLVFLVGVVVFGHHPAVFLALLLFFLGYTSAYTQFQNPLILKEAMLVGFFLAGLITLGGMQAWWLQDTLTGMSTSALFFGATALTAITDNAALTYLGSLVEGVGDEFKYALVAGAVTGGGLTVIANAPNPAGFAILRGSFRDGSISPLGLLASALPPTLVAVIAFKYIDIL